MGIVNVTVFEVDDRLNFGKYKGKTVKEVLESDPQYLLWAYEKVEFFSMSEEAYEIARTLDDSKYQHSSAKYKGLPNKKAPQPAVEKPDAPAFDKAAANRNQPRLFDDFDDDYPF